jgi:hypothetical protein
VALIRPMSAELRKFTERVDYVCRTEVTAVPRSKQCFWRYVAHCFIGVTQYSCKRKENATVESAVRWRSIDLMEVVSDDVLTEAYGSVRRRTIK